MDCRLRLECLLWAYPGCGVTCEGSKDRTWLDVCVREDWALKKVEVR